ncbi:hypothetical protein BCR42DRAFT_416585, partial [Absidia repens]
MTKNDTEDTTGTLDQPCNSKQHNKRAILGHNISIHGLDDWHQVCFQWCQQQDQTKNCSMYCFKSTKSTKDEPLQCTEEKTSPTDTTSTDLLATNIGQKIKSYTTDALKNYSIVVVKGTDSTTDDYMKAHQNDPPARNPSTREINLGAKAETAVNNAELLVKKTHDFSKGLVHTWQNNNSNSTNKWINGFDYSGTFRIMKDRAVKMVDVARGKYDNDPDNLKKESPDQQDSDARNNENDDDNGSKDD